MAEPLTSALVAELMPRLYAAFPRAIRGDERYVHDTYRNGLRGLSGDAVRAAVDVVIREDTYFPKVARLREVAAAWQRRASPPDITYRKVPWNECATCGAKALPRTIRRLRRDPKTHALVRDEHGREIWEEVESTMLYMDHDAARHHVSRVEEESA